MKKMYIKTRTQIWHALEKVYDDQINYNSEYVCTYVHITQQYEI